MTTYLDDLLKPEDLAEEIERGYVRRRFHPSFDYVIFNYTEKAQFSRRWNGVTSRCRGLIVDENTSEVLARPFDKFFNYGEAGAADIEMWEPVEVSDKVDGSLGILYPTPDGYAVATRGSFESEQALHATEVFRRKYAGWAPPEGVTVLFEIVYPENRIVVDYGDVDDLVLLDALSISSGFRAPIVLTDWQHGRARGPRPSSLSASEMCSRRRRGRELRVWWCEPRSRTTA